MGRIRWLQQRTGETGGLQAALRQSLEDARQELDAAIEAIREVGGYEDFLLPPTFEKIRRALSPAAPLVYLVTTPQGSLALIVQAPAECAAGTDGPDRSQLPFSGWIDVL